MKTLQFSRTFSIFAAAVLASCSGSQNTASWSPSIAPIGEARQKGNPARHDLLYVSSDFNGDVYVFTYPQRRLAGTLTNLNAHASGECVDASGDVFITTFDELQRGKIFEYQHGGTSPVAILSDPGEAACCAVDPTTGDLAVTNRSDFSSSNPYPSNGDLAIYPGAQGTPQMHYNDSTVFRAFGFCGYDNQGSLYISADDSLDPGDGLLLHFETGSDSFSVVNVNEPLYGALSVQWDGTYLTVASASDSQGRGPISVDRLSISGSAATVVGTTTLVAMKSGPQSWIQGQTIIGVNGNNQRSRDVSFWLYPGGGSHRQFIKNVGQGLFGVTVSLASPARSSARPTAM
jgi:hypothetical protein